MSNLNISISSKLKEIRDDFTVKVVNKYKKDAIGVIQFCLTYITQNQKSFSFLQNKEIFLDISFIDDNQIQKINFKYRNKKEPTNVISLSYFNPEDFNKNVIPNTVHLGEIFISFATMLKEAKEQKIAIEHHFFRLLIHGFLHLLGFDHIIEKDAILMYNTEEEILNKLKLPTNSIVIDYWR